MNKKIISIILICLMFIPLIKVDALTLQDLYDDLAAKQAQYSKVSQGKALTQSQMNQVKKEINAINSNISQIERDIQNATNTIAKSEKEIEEKKEETNQMLKFLQLSNGTNSYLEYIFEADSYTDLIYRFSIVKQLSNYNKQLMKELNDTINKMEQAKVELASKKTELTTKKNELLQKSSLLSVSIASYDKEGATVQEDIAAYRKEIKFYESQGCSRNQDVSTCMKVAPSSNGFSMPLRHSVVVSSEYTGDNERGDAYGGHHHGIDLWYNGIYGAPIYPVAAGTVARAQWISGGGNAVYIYHTVNGKQYTSVYMHMSGFGSGIRQGTIVTTNTVIGYVGNTGVGTGAHLHLGLANGHHATFFNSYSFNPRNVMSF